MKIIRTSVVVAWLAVVLACKPSTQTPPPPAEPLIDLFAEEDPQHLVDQRWESHLVRDAKVGHRHTRVYRLGPIDQPLLKIVAIDHLQIRRYDTVVEQKLTTISLESESGDVEELAYVARVADGEIRAHGRVKGQVLELTKSKKSGGSFTHSYRWSESQRGVFAVEHTLRDDPMQPGQRRSLAAFLAVVDRPVNYELVAGQIESTDVNGQPQDLLRIEAVDQQATKLTLPTIYWVNEAGQVVKTQEAFLNRQTVVVDRSEAVRPNDLYKIDFGIDVGVNVSTPIRNAEDTTRAVYRVQLQGLDVQAAFPSGLSQRVVPAETGVAMITVSRVLPDEPAAVSSNVSSRPSADDLEPNALIQSDHPRVIGMANAVAESIDDPWRAAVRMENYIYSRLKKNDYSQVFSSAGEVIDRGAGDCSEHAVLLAAACRARKIPARVVIGLVYSDADQSFLYHMWNQVWIKDRWVPLDATRGNQGISAAYLKLGDSSLARESAFSVITPVIYVIDRLKINVVAAQ